MTAFVRIPVEEDRAFRSFMLQACPPAVRTMFSEVLTAGPMVNGAQHSADYYGTDLHDILLLTVPVIDELEWFKPGFKKWLDGTGFGNDRRMIAAFAKWAELERSGDIRHGLHERAGHA